jgi:RNA polymerase sigma-70 factor (ECF subfamily)
LPPEQLDVVAKIYFEGKSHSEVANELSLPLGTVKSRIRLALNRLQLRMTAEENKQDD